MAKTFYSSLFGWDYDDAPIGDGQVYSMARHDGHNVAALFASDQPPRWNCYVTVDSVAAGSSTGRCACRGGRSRCSAIRRGAVFAVWTGQYDD